MRGESSMIGASLTSPEGKNRVAFVTIFEIYVKMFINRFERSERVNIRGQRTFSLKVKLSVKRFSSGANKRL